MSAGETAGVPGVPCDGCGGPTRFIGKGLYECTTGCQWRDPCPHALRFADCPTCNRGPAPPATPTPGGKP